MRRHAFAISIVSLVAIVLFAANTFKARPVTYDPNNTGIISAAWVTGIGLPDAGDSDHGLYLAKNGPTATVAAAVAVIDGVEGITVTELGYDTKDGGHCSGGAPRFNVAIGETLHFVGGCTNGTAIGSPAPGWTRYRFDLAKAFPPIPADATISSLSIVFDEGGSVVVDNIDVNGTLIGKPGNAK